MKLNCQIDYAHGCWYLREGQSLGGAAGYEMGVSVFNKCEGRRDKKGVCQVTLAHTTMVRSWWGLGRLPSMSWSLVEYHPLFLQRPVKDWVISEELVGRVIISRSIRTQDRKALSFALLVATQVSWPFSNVTLSVNSALILLKSSLPVSFFLWTYLYCSSICDKFFPVFFVLLYLSFTDIR